MRNAFVAILALVLVGCGKEGITPPNNPSPSPSPAPQPQPQANRAPTITAMNFAPTFGISGLTQFSFNASATDPDGDAVTFAWDVGGNPFTGSSGAATFTGSATTTARVTVTDARGLTASDSRTFTVGSMTGAWTVTSGPLQGATFNLTQTDTGIVTGTFALPGIGTGNTDPAQPGRIDAGANVTMRIKVGAFTDFNMIGRMTDTGRRVDGSLQGSGFTGQPFTMTK